MMRTILAGPGQTILTQSAPIPEIGPTEVLLKTDACGVCGTDVLKLNLSLLKKPTVLGHELVGTVVKAGAHAGVRAGERLVVAHHVPCFDCHFCRHGSFSMCQHFKATNLDPGGFADYVRLTEEHLRHTAFALPDDMTTEEAIFTEPLACCVRNVERLPLQAGDSVIIVGLGSIGLMMAALLNARGIRVWGLDLDATRRQHSLAFGVTQAWGTNSERGANAERADGVILTAGPAELLNAGLGWIRDGGFLNLFSHLSGELAPLDTAALYHRELQIITSYSASPDSLRTAFNILKGDTLKLRRMISGAYGPEHLAQAIDDINHRRVLKAVIRFA